MENLIDKLSFQPSLLQYFLIPIVIIIVMCILLKLISFMRDIIILVSCNSIIGLISLNLLKILGIIPYVKGLHLIITSIFGIIGTIFVCVMELIWI